MSFSMLTEEKEKNIRLLQSEKSFYNINQQAVLMKQKSPL